MSDIDIEFIVREVIRRLTSAAGDPSRSEADTVNLDERLVTMATLDGRLANARRLVVAKKAVVTPAVKDELKKRQITLEYEN